MVQHGNPLHGNNFYGPRENSWQQRSERSFNDIAQDRFPNIPQHPHHDKPLTVEHSLTECARIPVTEFVLLAILADGTEKLYSSSSLAPYRNEIINRQVIGEFNRSVGRVAEGRLFSNTAPGYSQDGMYSDFDVDSGRETRKHSSSGGSSSDTRYPNYRPTKSEGSDDDGSMSSRRKRARPSMHQRYNDSNEDTPVPAPAVRTQQLMIGNQTEVEKFYLVRFKDMQQSSCKVMGKAFVKLVEPKKQTHHPYTKGDEKAPPWWPKTTGDNSVRHKEPDHLLKPERIRLLVHILRMIVEPREKQCPTVQKLGLNARKLEEVTMEAMSNWFNDKEHPENASKRPFLKEIFKIAKAEERFKNGEIDGTTYFSVMYGDGAATHENSDDEGDDVKDEEVDAISASASMTSESLLSPALMQTQHMQPQSDGDNTMFSSRSRHLPMRFPQVDLEEQSFTDPACYTRTGMGLGYQPQSPNLQDPTRRSFASPGYHSPQQGNYGWISQNANLVSATTGPLNSSFYTQSPQPTMGHSASYQLPLPNSQSQQTMLPPPMSQHHSYDGLPNGRNYDAGPPIGTQLRTGSLGHPHNIPSHGYQEFLTEGSAFGQSDSELKDEQHIHQS